MSLRTVLGEMPSGKVFELTPSDVAKYINDNYLTSSTEERRIHVASQRLDLYQDRGRDQLERAIDNVFKNSETRRLRKQFADIAMYQNLTKRITNEISSVYSEKARRRVSDRNGNYQLLIDSVGLDRHMRKANRFTNLLNECLVWFRVRRRDRVMVCHVITPNKFYAIAHPSDPTQLIAVMFGSKPFGGKSKPTDPAWVVWSDTETFLMDSDGRYVENSWVEHGLGVMPGVLLHREVPDSSLLDPDPGSDLTSAHIAVALLNVMLLKEQKSGSKIPYTTGDLSATAYNQAMDSESLTTFQEGVSPGVLDMGSDPRSYIDSIRMVIKSIAASYGIPESVFDLSYQATSGFEIELKRTGLREKRRDQLIDYRPYERQIADVMSAVSTHDLPSMSYGTEDWSIDFGEVETPQEPAARLAYWEQERRMGLTTTIDMIMESNPEFTDQQAAIYLERNIALETERVRAMQEMQALGASPDSDVVSTDDSTSTMNAEEG